MEAEIHIHGHQDVIEYCVHPWAYATEGHNESEISSAYAGDHGLGRGAMRNSGGKLS